MQHELKCWPEFFRPMRSREKPFDVRRNDRGFQKGDTLWLREWNPSTKEYTGEADTYTITYVLSGWGIAPEHVVLGVWPGGRAASEGDQYVGMTLDQAWPGTEA